MVLAGCRAVVYCPGSKFRKQLGTCSKPVLSTADADCSGSVQRNRVHHPRASQSTAAMELMRYAYPLTSEGNSAGNSPHLSVPCCRPTFKISKTTAPMRPTTGLVETSGGLLPTTSLAQCQCRRSRQSPARRILRWGWFKDGTPLSSNRRGAFRFEHASARTAYPRDQHDLLSTLSPRLSWCAFILRVRPHY